MKILVVDDERAPLHLFFEGALSLQEQSAFHYFGDDVEKILLFARSNELDGAFLDIRMPHIDGYELARKLIVIQPRIKIVYVTGYNVTLNDVPEDIRDNVLGIAYKPLKEMDLTRYVDLIKSQQTVLYAKTFGSFDCFVHGNLVRFSSSKSKELFALLIVNDGKSVTMEQAITALWPDKDLDKAKILYRDAVWRLRSTLKEIGVPCVEFSRALLSFDKTNVECDYYDLLHGKDVAYGGEFLVSYEWSLPYEYAIERYLGHK